MKRFFTIFAVMVLFASALGSCSGGSVALKTDIDSLSYSMGVDVGTAILSIDSTMNPDIVAMGIRDALNRREKISHDDALAFFQEYIYVRKPAREREAGARFLEQVKRDNPGIVQTESGLLYEIIEEGGGEKPGSGASIQTVYHGTLPDGRVFDSSRERGDTLKWYLDRLIDGWSEGLALIGKGGRIKLWIPSELAYGERGYGIVPANSPIVYDVELIDFEQVNE